MAHGLDVGLSSVFVAIGQCINGLSTDGGIPEGFFLILRPKK